MRICHFTNTFLPHVGGVARAVQTLLEDQRRSRHRVLVVAPEFDEGLAPRRIERSVLRIPAFTHFNDSDFSVRIPFAATLSQRLAKFRTDIIHAHHPFLLGDTALREAASRQVPIVFTHHTLYEQYTHYLPIESEVVGDIAAEIATRFANNCSAVIAPSQSVADLIRSRGVAVPIHVIPTGIDCQQIAQGEGARARQRWRIPASAPVIGHLGRFAAEKNLPYLAEAVARTLKRNRQAWALFVGDGPSRAAMDRIFNTSRVGDRVIFTGKLSGRRLHDACAAMDLFAFSSKSETQGLVLAEVMVSGTPVIALDASGAREVVRDRHNGRLLPADATVEHFARALSGAVRSLDSRRRWSEAARRTAAEFDRIKTSDKLQQLYQQLFEENGNKLKETNAVARVLNPIIERISTEGRIIADKAGALFVSRSREMMASGTA